MRRALAARLEAGAGLPLARAGAELWASVVRPERSLSLPKGVRVIGVGGATLGGSGVTPVAIELARLLALRGARVGFVGHGYRSRVRRPRLVEPHDDVEVVGDEALLAAQELRALGVSVMIGPRQRALELGARLARVLVVDGLLQAKPQRLALSVLVVDGQAPWGAGACPPRGDLRALPERLLGAADEVAALIRGEVKAKHAQDMDGSWHRIGSTLALRRPSGQAAKLGELAGRRVGLAVAIARPQRLLEQLRSACHRACVRAPGSRPRSPQVEARRRRSRGPVAHYGKMFHQAGNSLWGS